AFVRDGHLGRQGEGVVAVVPLLTFGGHRIQAGVDHLQPFDAHGVGGGLEKRANLSADQVTITTSPYGDCHQPVGHLGIHHHGVVVDHGANGVEMHRGSVLVDRHGQDAVCQAEGGTPHEE